jgi:hypothetical protein
MSLIHADGNTYHARYQFPIPLQQNLKIQRNFTKSTASPFHQSIHHHHIGCGTCVCGNGLSRRQGIGNWRERGGSVPVLGVVAAMSMGGAGADCLEINFLLI